MNTQSNLGSSQKVTPRKLRRFPPEPMVVLGGNESFVLIPLTKGKFAIVDCDDVGLIKDYVWSASKNGTADIWYAKATINGKTVRMHRFLLGLKDPKIESDHIDGNGLDNRRDNLRVSTRLLNGKNRRKIAPASSKYKGVHWAPTYQKWRARIEVEGVRHNLGSHATEEAAARVYNAAALRLHGSFARLNELTVP